MELPWIAMLCISATIMFLIRLQSQNQQLEAASLAGRKQQSAQIGRLGADMLSNASGQSESDLEDGDAVNDE